MRICQVAVILGLIVSGISTTASAIPINHEVGIINQLDDTAIGASACGPTSISYAIRLLLS